MSMLFLNFENSSGNQLITSDITSKTIDLKHYQITWDALNDSLANGPLINLRIEHITKLNRSKNNEIPLFNDITKQVSTREVDLKYHLSGKLSRDVKYSLHRPDGTEIVGVKSIMLLFEY